jgi:hypothetical protein
VQGVAKFMKQGARVVKAQQGRLALGRFGEIHDIDDDGANIAGELLLAAKATHPGPAALAGPGEIVPQKEPDRATLAYCQRSREAFPGVPVVAGGVDASLRRLAHYDYWSDTVRRSIILDSKADLVVFGMGERTVLEVARGLDAGKTVKELRDIRGVAYRLGASEPPPAGPDTLELPTYETVTTDKLAFCEMTRISHLETNPHNARRLVQRHGREAVVVNPPRKGLEAAVLAGLLTLRPAKIIYMSCNPDSFARDASRLMAEGYRLDEVSAHDLLPQTRHTELLARFSL